MSNLSDFGVRQIVAYVVGALVVGYVGSRLAPLLKGDPGAGVAAGLVLNHVVQPAITNYLMQFGA